MLAYKPGIIIRTIHDSLLLQCGLLKSRLRKVRHRVAKTQPSVRVSVRRLDLQPNAYFQVYWKSIKGLGQGPCVSFYVFEEEVLKFDCFGEKKGHYHIYVARLPAVTGGRSNRLFFREDTVADQIDRTEFELRVNCSYYLQRNWDSRIERFRPDQARLTQICKQIKQHMLELQQQQIGSQTAAEAA